LSELLPSLGFYFYGTVISLVRISPLFHHKMGCWCRFIVSLYKWLEIDARFYCKALKKGLIPDHHMFRAHFSPGFWLPLHPWKEKSS
jgi:hypothetical protein